MGGNYLASGRLNATINPQNYKYRTDFWIVAKRDIINLRLGAQFVTVIDELENKRWRFFTQIKWILIRI